MLDLIASHGEQFLTLRRVPDKVLVFHRHPLIARRNRIVGTIVTITDETRLRRLEDQAQRSDSLAEMGEMAASIAHEVRNPLASLRGCIQEIGEYAHAEQRFRAASSHINNDENDDENEGGETDKGEGERKYKCKHN